jgi:hypothetical protein
MIFRGTAGLGHLVLSHDLAGVHRAEHQGPHGQIGSGGQSHGITAFEYFG